MDRIMDIYINSNNEFINPYNFILISEEIIKSEVGVEKLHSGCINCMLTVRTPLVIPGNVTKDIDGHKFYPAYKIDNQLAIPGSSIRGMLRSVYEAATNSCMSTITPNEHITKRSDGNFFSPGVLKLNRKSEKWELYPAKRIALVGTEPKYQKINGEYTRFVILLDEKKKYIEKNNEKLYFGQEVYIDEKNLGHKKIIKRGNKPEIKVEVWNGVSVESIEKRANTNCYLYLGEAIKNKHAEGVFKVEDGAKPVSFSNDTVIQKAIDELEYTLKMYRSESVNHNLSSDKDKEKHYGYYGYEGAKENGAIPIWYEKTGDGRLKLSMAAKGRVAVSSSIGDLSNKHAPCNNRESLCPACSVFGMVGYGNENKGKGSLIRVTDALATDEAEVTPEVTLKELGSPRTSYLPFYSEKGKDYDENGARIRGRKFYWHIPAASNDEHIYSTTEKTKRNATFDLINVGSKYTFKVYYDCLTDEQLRLLLWTIQLPSDAQNGKALMHKLGHGKPLGLGSVEITVLNNQERSYLENYKIIESSIVLNNCQQPALLHRESWEKLEKMLEFDCSSKENITYPFIKISEKENEKITQKEKEWYQLKENVTASHQWFSRFKKEKNEEYSIDNKILHAYERVKVEDKDFEKKKYKGIIVSYDVAKEYGFIKSEEKDSIYFRKSYIKGDPKKIRKDCHVEFEIWKGEKGKYAQNITILKE